MTDTPVTTPTGFAALGVPPEVDKGLAAAGFAQPFAIQTEAIPVALRGVDLCGRARTGSGKTLAFGVPMVVTDVGGPGEVARQSGAALAVPPEDPQALAAAIGRLANDPVARSELASRASEAARTTYSWEKVAAETIAVYEEAIGGMGR